MSRHHLLLLLVPLICIISSVSADVFVSIDCGSSALTYTDRNLIVWTGDDNYIQNGESRVVRTRSSYSAVLDTLRVFTTRKKNCYSITADRGGRVLVRASFYYGNYDQKSSPPSFDLQFDGNHWASVETSIGGFVYYEVIYVVKGDSTSVCVAQTKADQFPFISALEVRSLGETMYNDVDSNRALHLTTRIACGTNQTIRYIDDIYDRIWSPMNAGNGLINVASDAFLIYNTKGDNPPRKVLQNAITASTTSQFIQLGAGLFPSIEIPAYINMYFSEVTQLDPTQKRSFRVFKGNQSFSDPILPPYGNFTELYVSNLTVSSNVTFFLVATPDSTLPPLINAMEVFFISDSLTDGTNTNDVEGLASLQNSFDALQDWSGDPCLPETYSWDWVSCSSDATPRITALYLSSLSLSGILPDISYMNSLETIDLQNNSFSGPIPDFLGELTNLKELNLADNQFTGEIPDSLARKNGLKLVITGNPELCKSGNTCRTPSSSPSPGGSSVDLSGNKNKKKQKKQLPLILGITIPAFLVIWAILGIFAILHYKRKTASVVAVTKNELNKDTNRQATSDHADETGHQGDGNNNDTSA